MFKIFLQLLPLCIMTVAELQAINKINKTTPDTFEQLGYIICELYSMTVEEVNALSGKEVLRRMAAIQKEVAATAKWWTRQIPLQTDATKITFGQFIECQQWLKCGDSVQVLDMVAASILIDRTEHSKDVAMIRKVSFARIKEQVDKFILSMNDMLMQYKGLFEIDVDEKEDRDENEHPFISQYSWILSAAELAKHERITLDKAFDLPVLQAFNGLAYLKAKALYEKMKSKK